MTDARDPSDYSRQLRYMNRRLEQLEDTQVSPQEFENAFDRVYEEIDELKVEVREMKTEIGEMRRELRELNDKFDIIMHHITQQSNS